MRRQFAFACVMGVLFSNGLTAWATPLSHEQKRRVFKQAVRWGECLLKNYECNLAVSGVDVTNSEQDASYLLPYLVRRGSIDFDAPEVYEFKGDTVVNADCSGTGVSANIRLFEAFYFGVSDLNGTPYVAPKQIRTILHEVGHAASLDHPTHEDSEDWNRAISENCLTLQRLKECGNEFQRLAQ